MSFQDKTARLQERTAKRAATREQKKQEAEVLKEKGNEHYRKGQFADAAKCYEDAIVQYGPRAVYMNNLAAALLKLEKYDEAEAAATQALRRDHKLLKARFRRGLARKNMGCYRSAILDFEDVLKQDSMCEEARVELTQTKDVYKHVGFCADDPDDLELAAEPLHDEPDDGNETGFESDSSDFFHEGNGVPCRFYNRDGCLRSPQCRFKHAPDDRSVRDKLGRNVCALYLLGMCKFSDSKCVYAHDKTYLPHTVWDDKGSKRVAMEKRAVRGCLGGRTPLGFDSYMHMVNLNATGPMCIPRLRNEFYVAKKQFRSPWSGIIDYEPDVDEVPDWGSYDYSDDEGSDDSQWEDEDEEGIFPGGGHSDYGEFGFSEDDVQELIAQGVKPWDDDASDVLAALHSM